MGKAVALVLGLAALALLATGFAIVVGLLFRWASRIWSQRMVARITKQKEGRRDDT